MSENREKCKKAEYLEMTDEIREQVIGKVSDLATRGVLKLQDAVVILEVCRQACDRRMAEINAAARPESPIQ